MSGPRVASRSTRSSSWSSSRGCAHTRRACRAETRRPTPSASRDAVDLSALAPNVVHDVWPWAALLLLGAAHGINPGMGWLFAVALGMQRQERGAVWRALAPLAAGHLAAIGVVAAVVGAAGLAISRAYACHTNETDPPVSPTRSSIR